MPGDVPYILIERESGNCRCSGLNYSFLELLPESCMCPFLQAEGSGASGQG